MTNTTDKATLDKLIKQLIDSPPSRARSLALGEYYAELSKSFGKLAATYLFEGQWAFGAPEWFDHRLHVLDPEEHWNDFWTMSPDNVTPVLPMGGALLDLCSGDGFYDYHFYRHRASKIICVENNKEAFEQARRLHSDPKIEYLYGSVLDYGKFVTVDVVVCRGAIEHFNETEQQQIFKLAYDALKPGGWFVGDTPAKRPGQGKMLNTHEHEWEDEGEMVTALRGAFRPNKIETLSLVSIGRTTLLWRCQK